MRAIQITGYGGQEVTQYTTDAPKPTLAAGQVLVEVRAAGVNPFDWKLRAGYMQQMVSLTFPATLGGDFSGVVVELGEGVHDVNVGDAVYGQASPVGGQGSFAEFTPVDVGSLGPKPATLDDVQAAALPLAGVSAYQALVGTMRLARGQKILIHGGAGGIGTMAIQLAHHIGAHVATTARAAEAEYVRSLGADEVIDYETQSFEKLLHDFDAVFDTVGGEVYKKSYQVLKPGGIIVSMLERPDETLKDQFRVRAVAQHTKVTTERLAKLTELIIQNVLKVHVDKVFPLERAGEALDYLREGSHRGKVVLDPIPKFLPSTNDALASSIR